MIHRFEGGGFKFCPTADCTDGRFELCVAGDVPKPVILLALPTAFSESITWCPASMLFMPKNHYQDKQAPVGSHGR